ncbi:Holliday junction branch migration protein RuvA [Secundilactobacillus kimchicus]|uniref:Holliday junction branch migration protein RuvA n=1 Tax=Secundilactobacillus kimchicus TaxID=528209 RepID=UPI0024A8629B|nr:Holliday junction branch migration protein RuvA [Secundilactobacillus kimchicus]
MYEYLEGTITAIKPAYIVVDVAGVGYLVRVGNPFHFLEGQEHVKVYVHQTVSDTAQTLYGFAAFEEKQLFEKLLAVSGIGAKSALAILANGDQKAIVTAINTGDVGFLTKFPGVGKKTAQQIVLDLRDKITELTTGMAVQPALSIPATQNPALDDALAALEALGYRAGDVKKTAKYLATLSARTTDEYLSDALKQLTKP